MKPPLLIAGSFAFTTLLFASSEPSGGNDVPQLSTAPATMAFTGTPPDKFSSSDTLEWRLRAVRMDLLSVLATLKRAPTGPHGGFVEKAIADVNQGLDDTDKSVAYVAAHPAINPISAWDANNSTRGSSPKPMGQVPLWVGSNGRAGLGAGPPVTSAGAGVDQNLIDAVDGLRLTGIEMANMTDPYDLADMGGNRDLIRDDMRNAVAHIVAAMEFARDPIKRPASPDSELVVNGGFEDVQAQTRGRAATSGHQVITEYGMDTGLGWRVTNANTFQRGAVTLLHEGYSYTSGATTNVFAGPAYEGHQWLDLSGGTAAGCASQILPTEAGKTYVLNFAYANSPFPPLAGSGPGNFGPMHPISITVTVKDTASDADLIQPLKLSHDTSTSTDYYWSKAGPISFVAKGDLTTLQFTPNYDARSMDGMFLDAVSVKAAPKTSPATDAPKANPATATATSEIQKPSQN